jgi:hypothetical protein
MATKQEPRPAYHRRQDLRRLQEYAMRLPVLVSDRGHAYAVHGLGEVERDPLFSGRYEVVYAYLSGWRDGQTRPQ